MPRLGLDEAYQELKTQCDHHRIEVPHGRHIIIRDNTVTPVLALTSKRDCMKMLKRIIKEMDDAEFKRTQGGLFDDPDTTQTGIS